MMKRDRALFAVHGLLFTADECEAIGAGDLTAELRARVNRAIALLSRGASEPARAMLTAVL